METKRIILDESSYPCGADEPIIWKIESFRFIDQSIYLESTQCENRFRIAYDEDTKYWIFDDSCEPVGLTCEPKENWTRITKEEFDNRR